MYLAKGVQHGDRVAVIARNRIEWAISAYAAYQIGALHVPMYEQQKVDDWKYILHDSEPKLLLCANERILQASGRGLQIDTLVFDTDIESHSFHAELKRQTSTPETTPGIRPVEPSDIATLIYTSGTTGRPKGVELSHDNIVSNVKGMLSISEGRINQDTVSLSFLPWAHVYGQTAELHCLMSAGASMGLAESTKTLLDDLQIVKPTVLVAVPTVYNKVFAGIQAKKQSMSPFQRRVFDWAMEVAKERRDWFDTPSDAAYFNIRLSPFLWVKWKLAEKLVFDKVKKVFGGRLRWAMTGGAALAFPVQEFFDDIKIPILEGYGATETAPISLVERYGPTEKTQGGLRPLPGVHVVLCNPAEEEQGGQMSSDKESSLDDAWKSNHLVQVPPGFEGEICVVGPNVMRGYWRLPEETQKSLANFNGQRAFRSGDLGFIDPETGAFKIKGRVKEQYKLENGKFVVPGPIEDVIRLKSRFIAQSFVWGLNKPFNVALLVPDFAALRLELDLSENDKLSNADLVGMAKLRNIVHQDLMKTFSSNEFKQSVKAYAAPHFYAILDEEFSVENGNLTPKLSMKRPVIEKQYSEVLQSLYDGSFGTACK